MSLETAQAWYEYGNVLLLKEEENPTNDLLGNVQQDPSHPNEVPEDEDVGEEDEPDNEAGADDGEEGGDFEDEDEPEGDLQIAWEALDVSSRPPVNSRLVLSRYVSYSYIFYCSFRWHVLS